MNLLFIFLFSVGQSCQEIVLSAQDGGVVVGKSFEFNVSLNFHIVTEPAGTRHDAPKLPNCPEQFSFSNRFKTMAMKGKFDSQWTVIPADGFNEAGLSATTFYFRENAESDYVDPSDIQGVECDRAVPQLLLAQYILANYETVEQVKKDIDMGQFPVVWSGVDLGIVMPMHYSIVDKTGAGLVLEFLKGEGMKWHDNTIGVMTNAPPYAWHMENLRNYPHFQKNDRGREGFKYSFLGKDFIIAPHWTGSGLRGLPGDYTSPSRFIKAATLLSLIPTPNTSDEAITQVFHLMNAADIPYGVIYTEADHVLYTRWIAVKDLGRGCVYYRGYTDLSVKRLCFENIPDVKSAVRIEGRFEDAFRDASDELKNLESIDVNDQLI